MSGRWPDFIIIGAQRCGTTSLYDALTSSAAIAPAVEKEVHFFDLQFRRGAGWYRSCFDGGRPGLLTGEASPYYLFHPAVPERVHALLPEVRLIALVREPVDRAWSHYHHEVRQGAESLTFADAVRAEAQRLAGEEAALLRDPDAPKFNHRHHSYLARGRYVEQLERWWACFPTEQLLVVRSEDLYGDAAPVLADVAAFLGLAEDALPGSIPWANRGGLPAMGDQVARRLHSYFAEPNHRLADALGRDLRWSR